MTSFGEFHRRLRYWLARDRATHDLEQEMQLHRELRAQALQASGVPADEARYAATRAFGNSLGIAEQSREMWGFVSLDNWRLDVRQGFRGLRKTPAFTLAAIATLTLGIGAATTIFSVANALWLTPLPFAEPSRLVAIRDSYKGMTPGISLAELSDLQRVKSLQGVAAFQYSADIVKFGNEPIRVVSYRVSDNLFAVLGATPTHGRTFVPGDAAQRDGPLVILSDSFWRTRMAADPNVVGKTILMYGTPHTVVGVMPRKFHFPMHQPSDVWTLISSDGFANASRSLRFAEAVGRITPGVTAQQVTTELSLLAHQLQLSFPETNKGWTVTFTTLVDDITAGYRRAFMLLLCAVGLLLLIACANIAGLFLARGTARQAEYALRTALGATRGRLITFVLTECLLLAGLSGACGLAFAHVGAQAMRVLLPASTPRLEDISTDFRVVAFVIAMTLVTGVLCALAPTSRISIASPGDALRASSRTVVRGGHRLQSGLIVTEVAFSLILLVGAGLMLRTFLEMLLRDRGYNPESVLALNASLPYDRYSNVDMRHAAWRSAIAAMERIPGVTAVGAVTGYPGGTMGILGAGTIADQSAAGDAKPVAFALRASSPAYFRTMETPLLKGRGFNDADRRGSTPVFIVNEALADALWPSQNPIGKRLALPPQMAYVAAPDVQFEVVGVTANMRLGRTASPEIFIPLTQSPAVWTELVIRTDSDPGKFALPIQRALRAIEPDFLIEHTIPMSDVITNQYALQRTQAFMVGTFALFAALLAGVGLYGLLSHFVGERKRDIGIRMALGARQSAIFRAVVARGLALTLLGIGAGAGAALALVRILNATVFGLAQSRPDVFLGATVVLILSALVACCVPAWRATRVDPVTVLRQ